MIALECRALIDPPSANLAYPLEHCICYLSVNITIYIFSVLTVYVCIFWQMTRGENGIDFKLATINPVSTTTTLGTSKQLGCCSKVALCYKNQNCTSKIVVAVGRWLLLGGGRQLRLPCFSFFVSINSNTTYSHKKNILRET